MAKAILLTRPEVEELCQLSRWTIHRLVKSGQFPRPLDIGKALRWHRSEIEHWAATHKRAA